MERAWLEGPIVERRDWTSGLATFRIGVDLPPFKPGQWVELATDGPEGVSRAMSIASPPGAPVELFIALVEEGELTPRLWPHREGDSLWVRSPAVGKFTLDRVEPARSLWCVSTGTGLAPFLSMVRSGEVFSQFENVVLCHGVRMREDLAYRDEIEGWVRARPGRVHYLPMVTREPPGPGELSGRVTEALRTGHLDELAASLGAPLTASDAQVMLCGNPAMVDEMLELLATRGMEKHRSHKPGRVHIEAYW